MRPKKRSALQNHLTYQRLKPTIEYRLRIQRRRKAVKGRLDLLKRALKEAGCLLCGEVFQAALHFHHVWRETKRFDPGKIRNAGTLKAEARKCVVLCANCHSKVENGFFGTPEQTRAMLATKDTKSEEVQLSLPILTIQK